MQFNLIHTVVGILLVAIIAFLFTTVAANAIAIVGSNPVSGMTLMTLILASVVMVGVGLKGNSGMLAALLMGGVVCTALSMAGSFITDLKIGYWLGTTPKKQETWKFLGTIVSAATVAGVMIVLDKTYGFNSGQLAAPQANAMAAVIKPLMSGQGAPLDSLRYRCCPCIGVRPLQGACIGFLAWYVYSYSAEYSSNYRWCGELVCYNSF